MKYKGVVVLSVREYLGYHDGSDLWMYLKHVVGIKEGKEVWDYKTGEKYNYISRNECGLMQTTRDQLSVGNTYAIEFVTSEFQKGESYSKREIERFIQRSSLFLDDYKNIKTAKRLVK